MHGVPADAGEAPRSPGVLPRQAQDIQPRAAGDAAGVHGVAAAVEDRHLDPAVLAAESGCPDHRADPAGLQIEFSRLVRRLPGRRLASLVGHGHAAGGDERVDRVLDALRHGVGLIQAAGEIGREAGHGLIDRGQPPVQPHPLAGEDPQVDVMAAVAAGDVVIGPQPQRIGVLELINPAVVVAHRVQPGHHVAAAVAAGDPRRAAGRQVHPPTGQVQVLGDLAAGLAGAHHQDRAIRKRARVAVARGVQRRRAGGQPLGHARNGGSVIRAGRQHHLPGGEVAAAGGDLEAVASVSPQPGHLGVLLHRRPERVGVAFYVGDDLFPGHEAVWIWPLVRVAGQLALPVGCDQAKRIPAALAPFVAYAMTLEDNMVDAIADQAVAHGEAGLSGADNDSRIVPAAGLSRRPRHRPLGSPGSIHAAKSSHG